MNVGLSTRTATLGRCTAGALRRTTPALALLGLLAFSSPIFADPAGVARGYKLAPGDRITVTVLGQTELSGDIVIDSDGLIALPLLEPLEVNGLTVAECQKLIRDRLADGVLQHPAVSVRISELRPLYVSGDVHTPGAYPYRYGSTVQSAVAVAGGFGPNEPLQTTALVSDFLLADERARQLNLQKQTLLIRQARLEAQRDGMKTFAPPPPSGAMEEHDLAAIVANERDTFDTQAAILDNQMALVRSQKPRIQEEIVALNAQIASTKKQLQVIRDRAEQYKKLQNQGLALANTEVQLKLNEASQESEFWRLTAQVSRLQMDSGDLDLRISEAEAVFKRQVAVELRDVRDRIKELEITLPIAREVRDTRLQYVSGVINLGVKRSITVTRVQNGQAAVFDATETTPLEPGDIVDVKRLLTQQGPIPSAAAGQLSAQPYQIGVVRTPMSVGSASR